MIALLMVFVHLGKHQILLQVLVMMDFHTFGIFVKKIQSIQFPINIQILVFALMIMLINFLLEELIIK